MLLCLNWRFIWSRFWSSSEWNCLRKTSSKVLIIVAGVVSYSLQSWVCFLSLPLFYPFNISPLTIAFFFFWESSSIHCLAALDFVAGVNQPLDCHIVQKRQAVQSMWKSMDWTLENNMVDGLFFYATLTGRRGDHTSFVQAGAETFETGAEAVEPDPGSSWEGHSWCGHRCLEWKCGVLLGCPPTLHSIDDPPTAPNVCCCCQKNWWVVVRPVQMGVSIERPCICTRWTGERWVDQVSTLHGTAC